MKKILRIALAALLALTVLASCGKSNSGTVSTDGSTSMQKVIGALGEQFQADHKGIDLYVQPHRFGFGHHRQFPRDAATSVFPAVR